MLSGVVGLSYGTEEDSRVGWKARPKKVTALYMKFESTYEYPEYGGTREILSESGRTTSQG